MNPKVEELLQKAREKEQEAALKKKTDFLRKHGLCNSSGEVEIDDPENGYDRSCWNEEGEIVYYRNFVADENFQEVTDEEYEQLLKYYPPKSHNKNKTTDEDNGEGFIMGFMTTCLILTIIIALVSMLVILNTSPKLFGGLQFCATVLVIICSLFAYFTTKVFVNISRKSTAIYQLLKEQKQSEK